MGFELQDPKGSRSDTRSCRCIAVDRQEERNEGNGSRCKERLELIHQDLLQKRLTSSCLIREPKLTALLCPAQRDAAAKLSKSEVSGLTALQDRLDDVRREECASEDQADVSFRRSSM